jgi:hypothetical protein
MAKRKPLNQQELDEVYYFVDDSIATRQRFCSTAEIASEKKLPYARVEELVDALVSTGRLKIVYEVPKKVRLFAPSHIVEGFAMSHPLVPWLPSHYFPEKAKLLRESSNVQSQLRDFEQFEMLLTATGKDLVNAVGHTLKWLDFNVRITESQGQQDVEFNDGRVLAILEVKGLERHARIDELRQAVDYHLRKSAEKGDEEILTILLVNHFRQKDPAKREPPFSKEVLQAANKNYGFISLVTTMSLYSEVGKCLSGTQSKGELRKKIMNRQLDYKPS